MVKFMLPSKREYTSAIFIQIQKSYDFSYSYTIDQLRRIDENLGYVQWHVEDQLSLDIVTVAVESPPIIISNVIFTRIR